MKISMGRAVFSGLGISAFMFAALSAGSDPAHASGPSVTTAGEYQCTTSFGPLANEVYSIDLSLTSSYDATVAAGTSATSGSASLSATIDAAAISDLQNTWSWLWNTYKVTDVNYLKVENAKVSTGPATSPTAYAVETIQTGGFAIPASGAQTVTDSAIALPAIPTSTAGTVNLRLPDNSNVTDPWYASGSSDTPTLAFTAILNVDVSTNGGTGAAQDVLFRCGVEDGSADPRWLGGPDLDGASVRDVTVTAS